MRSWIIDSNEYSTLLKKSIFDCIYQFMVFKNLSKLYSFVLMASHYCLCQKNQAKHFNQYNKSIIIWYGLWCKVFGTSKVQYVIVTQNILWNSYNVIISHVILFLIILFTYCSFIFCSMAHDW